MEAAPATLRRLGLLDHFEREIAPTPQGNRTAFISREAVEQVGDLYRTAGGATIDMDAAVRNSTRRWLRVSSFTPDRTMAWTAHYGYGRLVPATSFPLRGIAQFGLKNALPFGIDAAWQLAADWNTDMPVGYRIGRPIVSGVVGFGAGYGVSLATGWVWGALGLAGGPPAWAVIGVGVVVGVTIEARVANGLNEWLFPVQE